MSRRRLFGPLLVAAAVLALGGCSRGAEEIYQGWIEANFVFIGPDEAGRVETLSVREGDNIAAGAPLFTLDADLQQAEVFAATGSLTNARRTFERAQELIKTGVATQSTFDAAQAALREAEARLNTAQTRLARRRVVSPAAGLVQQIYFRQGEQVPAGRPIIALLPPGNIKVRFFVPQAMLPKISVGDAIRFRCDGCREGLTARIRFISGASEFTPPVIYSLEERWKLVFLIEAWPDNPEGLRVGQPVDVVLAPKEQGR